MHKAMQIKERKTHIVRGERYVCPWCWFESELPRSCSCGYGPLKRERIHILSTKLRLTS